MKFLMPTALLTICLGFGCATKKQETSFEGVPPASNVDPAVSSLASAARANASQQQTEETNAERARATERAPADKPILTPESGITGKVMIYNAPGRFVVLSFPAGQMPMLDIHLFVYRNGLKTGEVKITGPQRDDNIVADLVTGDARAGDEVRDK